MYTNIIQAEIHSKYLSVISSANQQSNEVQSFIIIKQGQLVKEGIKLSSKPQILGQQTPFVIRYTKPLEIGQTLQWQIKIPDKSHGTVNILSKFKGSGKISRSGYLWKSKLLNASEKSRAQLVFRPKPFSHHPSIYKKGKGRQGKRRQYGGGTRNIAEKKYNPKFTYEITLRLFQQGKQLSSHKTTISMDKKDMIRQEYINHYNIKRYGRGKNGHIPIPKRSEISQLPNLKDSFSKNPLTESRYKLIIDDGMRKLANQINQAYLTSLKEFINKQNLLDLNAKPLVVPNNKLWVTSGWRNPERNEWYSNAVNGIHQRGGAVDLIIMAPSSSQKSAIGYWILWKALEKNKKNIKAFWQLETNGRPMTSREFKQDIEPKNGIPDAFDKADHLHANINY